MKPVQRLVHRWFPPFLLLLATAFVVAGCATASVPRVQPGRLTGEAQAAEGAISIVTDDWTYGVPLDGVSWTDRDGTWHDKGRPDCLAPSGQSIPIRFAALEVTIDGQTWRPVVWIGCP
jgi:hypothetical protein